MRNGGTIQTKYRAVIVHIINQLNWSFSYTQGGIFSRMPLNFFRTCGAGYIHIPPCRAALWIYPAPQGGIMDISAGCLSLQNHKPKKGLTPRTAEGTTGYRTPVAGRSLHALAPRGAYSPWPSPHLLLHLEQEYDVFISYMQELVILNFPASHSLIVLPKSQIQIFRYLDPARSKFTCIITRGCAIVDSLDSPLLQGIEIRRVKCFLH